MMKQIAKRAAKLMFRAIGLDVVRHHAGSRLGFIISWTHASGDPVSFFVLDEHDEIQREHIQCRFYEPEELSLIAEHFRGGVFLDVGANVGNHAIFAAVVLKASKVIAIEPNPDAYRILRVNIALNGQHDRILHLPVALSDAPTRAVLLPGQSGNLGSAHLETESGDGPIEVTTGDVLIGDEQVSFIKIDTEGMELSVVKGLSHIMRRDRPVLFVEVDDANADAMRLLLTDHSYAIRRELRRYPGIANVLATPL